VPNIMTRQEAVRLTNAINNDPDNTELHKDQMDYAEFIRWIGLAALTSCENEPLCSLYPTPLDRVGMMLERIDGHRKMKSIFSEHSVLHQPHFATKRRELEEAEAVAARRQARKDAAQQIQEFTEGLSAAGCQEKLHQIFEFYCCHGEQEVREDLNRASFYKLVKECDLIDSGFPHARVDLVFIQAMGQAAVANRNVRMPLDRFLVALELIAECKQPSTEGGPTLTERVLKLVQESVLPNAQVMEPLESHDELIMSEEVTAVQEEFREALEKVFKYYCTQDDGGNAGHQHKKWADTEAELMSINLDELWELFSDFELREMCPHLTLARYLRLGNGLREEVDDDASTLTLNEYFDLLARVALDCDVPSVLFMGPDGNASYALPSPEELTPELAAQRLRALIARMERSAGLEVMQRATGFTMGIDLAGATKQAARRAPSYLHPSVRALQEGSYESSMPRVGSPPYRLAGHSSGTEALDKSLADKTSMDELRKQVGELLNDTD